MLASSVALTLAAGTSKGAAPTSTIIVLQGGTFYEVPVTDYPSSKQSLKERTLNEQSQTQFWKIEDETIQSAKNTFTEGSRLRSVKTLTKKDLSFSLPELTPADCGLEESWKKTAKRIAIDLTYQAKTTNAKTKSTRFLNVKGFEIPSEFTRVDITKEDSLLTELVSKSNGDLKQAAEFKSGQKRIYLVPQGTEDEFRSYYRIYFKEGPKLGLKPVANIDFVESCP